MRIHTDHNGVAVNAISQLHDGTDVEGHVYQVLAGPQTTSIEFQRGPVREHGVNGLTTEALLEVLIHRTEHLNSKFPCRENAIAIQSMRAAALWFEARTNARQLRGVEGKDIA